MARIPDDVIARLKADVSLQRLVESHGITLKPHGQELVGHCPFHADKTPSLVISPKKNLWHCLGACQTGGTVIDWVMQIEGVSFRHAAELLLNDYQPSSLEATPVKQSSVTKLANLFSDNDNQQLLNQVIDYYHATLKQHSDALAYCEKRGITAEAIDTFKLGFSNRSLGYRLPEKNRKQGAALRQQLQTIGVYRQSGHEHFNGSLVIPVLDAHGNVMDVYGRKLLNNLRAGTPKHLYLPGPHQGVFNTTALESSDELILCESLIDALTFWCNGYKNVTCSYGVAGFTDAHLAAFKGHDIKRVLIAYDRDQAGDAAAEKLAKQLISDGMDCYRIQFPKGMDANEYALHVTPAAKSLGVVIRSAQWLGKGRAKTLTTMVKEDSAIDDVILPASPQPNPPKDTVPTHTNEYDITLTLDNRRYRIRGLHKNLSYDCLKINLLVSGDEAVHVDTFDVYAARPRASFIKQAAIELGVSDEVIKADIGKVLLKCESLQETHIQAAQAPKAAAIDLTEIEQRDALTLLKSKQLLKRIQTDFTQCGIVGEATNTLVGYLASVSRKLSNPLAVIIQSTSAAGKSSLMDAVLRFIPEEDKHQYSAMTGQSLYYLGETNLKHKVLAIAEEEGAAQAAYALKLLQSEGQLTIASTSKDPDSGELTTKEYKVEGPVMLFLTTTAIDIDEELLNRCLVLTVNEDRAQTQAIHQLQRQKRTLQGLMQKAERESVLTVHNNAQRLLKPLAVVNPYAEQLTFLSDQTRTRRDHEKYLTLIDSIALLHQYQRDIKTLHHNEKVIEYVEVTLEDIAAANQLAHEILGRTLDELPPQTRKLLTLIEGMVNTYCTEHQLKRSDYRFSRKAIRQAIGWTDFQVRTHVQRLVEMEYLLVHRGARGQSFIYELLYDGDNENSQPHVNGLIDIAALKHQYDKKNAGPITNNAGATSGQRARGEVSSSSTKNTRKASKNKAQSDSEDDNHESAYISTKANGMSYVQPAALIAASK